MSKFKLGDKVRLKESSPYMGEYGNPISTHIIGTIFEFKKVGLPIRVDWDSYANNYSYSDLAHAIPNNKLSRLVYSNLIPSDCGNYLTNPEE